MAKYLLISLAMILLGCRPKAVAPGTSAQQPSTREVSFKGYGGFELSGTLQLPEGKGPFPALLLLPGSGPSDRDGNQLPTYRFDILKDLAAAFAKKGIATYRFDKRAVPSKYGLLYPKTIPELQKFFGWNAFVDDAEGAFDTLKAQPEIDPTKVGVLGHSEGGEIALAMAGSSKPAALILVSTPARDLGTVLIDQIEHGYSAQFEDPPTLKKLGDETERVVAAIRKTKEVPNDVPGELKSLFQPYLSDYLYQAFAFQPTEAASNFENQVLVVQGSKDIQVSPTKDGPVLFAAFPKGKAEYYLAEGCSHLLAS